MINSPALAPLILLFAGILIPLLGTWLKRLIFPIAFCAVGAAVAVSLYNVIHVLNNGLIAYHFGGWLPPIGIEYVLDPLAAFLTLVINGIALVVLCHAKKIVELEIPDHKIVPYYALMMLLLTGYNGIVLTGDFFNLYVFLEISSLALYGIVAVGDRKSPVAAFRYLILGTIGGAFYLLGTGFLYLATGSLNMADVTAILPEIGVQPVVIVALALMVIGFGIKMAMFPLHGWLPDVYTHAPSATSAIMAPIGIKIGAYGILRIFFFVFGIKFVTQVFPVAQVIAWLSAVGIVYGSIMAMAQDEMKRMLAFSSVAQIGYIGLGIGMANPLGIIGAVLHILNHGMMKACLFLVAGNFRSVLGFSQISRFDDTIRKKMPWTTAAFVVGAMAMIGVPPTVGFFSKWYLALSVIVNKAWLFLGVILLSSLLNAVYFFRIIEKLYLKPLSAEKKEAAAAAKLKRNEVGWSMLIPTLVFAVVLVIIGIFNAFIVKGILYLVIPPGM